MAWIALILTYELIAGAIAVIVGLSALQILGVIALGYVAIPVLVGLIQLLRRITSKPDGEEVRDFAVSLEGLAED